MPARPSGWSAVTAASAVGAGTAGARSGCVPGRCRPGRMLRVRRRAPRPALAGLPPLLDRGASRSSSGRQLMARMPRYNSGPRVPWPAPRTPWPSFYRSGDTGRSTRALTAHPARSVHEGCASVARRGTNLLVGRGTARTAMAGTRPPSGERADGGLRTGRGPGTGEATPTHAPAGPFTRHGGLARPFPDDLPPAPCPLRG